ncbi:GNAT family N-acetyltransferase [Phytohabitans sp. ZYX-F-186]|uniref:GNAT family N-acetyltransferase n=1 Tax=Phytohabitans maris TaxID=3071409 RepID=A0ABU0ZQL2_9ACTN|nr:GNAT family N-acetyltransferase [Phytohabitans sp. ZYX-F-186]MDQ7908732.1 GNAT family N-acetyltransferase [Phytohabitans sp. ZYX-F-186]
MAFTIRPAGEGDLTAVGALHYRSRAATYSGFVPTDALEAVPASSMVDYWTERWRYERDTHQLTVATEEGGEVVGFTYLGPDEEPHTGILHAIHVSPDLLGRGVGAALMADALEKLAAAGWRHAVLWVLADNAHARGFYERGGWAPDGVRRDDFIGRALVHQVRYARPL